MSEECAEPSKRRKKDQKLLGVLMQRRISRGRDLGGSTAVGVLGSCRFVSLEAGSPVALVGLELIM